MSPFRRVNQALYLIGMGAREASFRTIKTIAECLADEIFNAAKGSSNSYSIKKKVRRMRADEDNNKAARASPPPLAALCPSPIRRTRSSACPRPTAKTLIEAWGLGEMGGEELAAPGVACIASTEEGGGLMPASRWCWNAPETGCKEEQRWPPQPPAAAQEMRSRFREV